MSIEITHCVIDKQMGYAVAKFRDTRSGRLAARHKIEKLERRDGVVANRYFLVKWAKCTVCKTERII